MICHFARSRPAASIYLQSKAAWIAGRELKPGSWAQEDFIPSVQRRALSSSEPANQTSTAGMPPPPSSSSLLVAARTAWERTTHLATHTTAQVKQAVSGVSGWVPAALRGGALWSPPSQRAATLHLEAALQHHHTAVMTGAAVTSSMILWRLFTNVGSILGVSGGLLWEAELLAGAGLVSVGAGLALRHRYEVSAEAVVARAMRALNKNPGVLEVLGAPLFKRNVYATVVLDGGVHFRYWSPRVRAPHLQVLFSVQGAEREGLVAARASKRQGKYHFDLLSVDCPAEPEGHHRIFLAGDTQAFEQGGLVDAMRPLLKHASQTSAPQLEAARIAEELKLRVASQPKALDQGGGMYPWERLSLKINSLTNKFQIPKMASLSMKLK